MNIGGTNSQIIEEPYRSIDLTTQSRYTEVSLLADNGAFTPVELQLPLTNSGGNVLQVAPFIDAGTVWNNSGSGGANGSTLLSTGLGLQWRTDNFHARIDWGIPLLNVSPRRNSLQDNGLYFPLDIFREGKS